MVKAATKTATDHLTMKLFAPGMTLLHRAGLGGLACTLKSMERDNNKKLLRDEKYPWTIEEDSVTLHFGKPEAAGEYLRKLFEYAFHLRKDGLIFLPGQYEQVPPTAAVLADLQAGLTLTFLQHGRVRALEKQPTTISHDPEGDGTSGVVVQYKKCTDFKHRNAWKELIDKNDCLVSSPIRVDGPISPGTVIRHVAFTGDTGAEETVDRMLPLYFAMVGCLSLPVNRGVAALLVPEVTNLKEFVNDRPAMTPTASTDCQIANAADAAFRSQVRIRDNARRDADVQLHGRNAIYGREIPACFAITFTPTPWASQQKSRVATIHVPPGEDRRLDRYGLALGHLPSRIVTRAIQESTGRGKDKTVTERQESFRSDSIIRPLIAENLALGRKWYFGFIDLMTKINPATDAPFRDRLPFERGGLHKMISDDSMWDEEGERIVVQAVHEAIRNRYGQIADENKSNPVAMRNRFTGEYDRLRLAFAGAKTEERFRRALCDLFSKAGRNAVLQKQWAQILPMLRKENWQHTRDLALLALCSYQGANSDSVEPSKPNN